MDLYTVCIRSFCVDEFVGEKDGGNGEGDRSAG